MSEKKPTEPMVEAQIDVEIRGMVDVRISLSKAREIAKQLDKGGPVNLDADDLGVTWDDVLNQMDPEISEIEFADPEADKEPEE